MTTKIAALTTAGFTAIMGIIALHENEFFIGAILLAYAVLVMIMYGLLVMSTAKIPEPTIVSEEPNNWAAKRLVEEWCKHKGIIIGVDWDDTIKPWSLNDSIHQARFNRTIELLKKCAVNGARLVLHTASNKERFNQLIDEARNIGLNFESVNSNVPDLNIKYGKDGKPYCNIYLDDRAGIDQALDTLTKANDEITFIGLGKNRLAFEEYAMTTKVHAMKYAPGREDGFVTMFTNGTKDSLGFIKTWYMQSSVLDTEIQIPYIQCPVSGAKVLLGEGRYLLKNDRGEYWSEADVVFECTYKKTNA